jgi:c-di-GMP-binding flagellar brake protein YcgR
MLNSQSMSSGNVISNAYMDRSPRYVAHWKIAIVCEDNGEREIFHGRTYELSMGGASVLCDRNIFEQGKVTVLLVLPWYKGTQKEKVVVIKSRMVYSVFSSDNHQFRIGLQFLNFHKDEGHFIEMALQSRRMITTFKE